MAMIFRCKADPSYVLGVRSDNCAQGAPIGEVQHFRRVVLRVFANRIVRAASSGESVQIVWQGWHFLRCDEN
eukprot:s2079_g5.t1